MSVDDSRPQESNGSGQGIPGLANLGALFGLLGLPNPLAPVITTMDQMRRGFDDLLTMIETLQKTLEQLNTTAERVNRMLDDVEMPMRAMGEVVRRMGPLTQMAESATSLLNLKAFIPGAGSNEPAAAKKASTKRSGRTNPPSGGA
jgi:hypothetical protein